MKKVLITGANSYIGTSFEKYVAENYSSEFDVHTIDMIDGSWRSKDFGSYDIVFHVAGLAHADAGKIDEATKAKYYAVNTDLAIETCKRAKADGIKQFVFLSSAIIYGDSVPYGKRKMITRETEPQPANFYGDSKQELSPTTTRLRNFFRQSTNAATSASPSPAPLCPPNGSPSA